MKAIISETQDGRFITQIPNSFGGLYPLIPHTQDCRSTTECITAIAEAWSNGFMPEDIEIEMRMFDDPRNDFGFNTLYPEAAREEGRCKHGVYVGGIGVDWMCGRCENGEN